MPHEADTSDTSQTRQAHIRVMLVHLEQQVVAAQESAPTDVATELSAIADAFVLLNGLDQPSRRRALDWLHQKFDADE
jgi:hypothetical protein